MISYIKGNLETKNVDSVVIDVGGIGYKIFMSVNSIDRLGETGNNVKVHTYMRVREDRRLKLQEGFVAVKSAVGITSF